MESEATTYAAIYHDGSFVEKDSLLEIQTTARKALFYLKKEYHSQHRTSAGNVHKYFKFKAITIEGLPAAIIIGDFEIISIGPQRGDFYSGLRIPFKILETKTNIVRDYMTSTNGFEVFKFEIIPLLTKLNELGTWAAYELHKHSLELETENKALKKKIKVIERELADLRLKL